MKGTVCLLVEVSTRILTGQWSSGCQVLGSPSGLSTSSHKQTRLVLGCKPLSFVLCLRQVFPRS
jgi:hypothetical protein